MSAAVSFSSRSNRSFIVHNLTPPASGGNSRKTGWTGILVEVTSARLPLHAEVFAAGAILIPILRGPTIRYSMKASALRLSKYIRNLPPNRLRRRIMRAQVEHRSRRLNSVHHMLITWALCQY